MRRIKSLIGLNRAIGFSVLARGWQVMAGPVSILLVARFFSLEEQGFYYTFGSVLALQVIFELGLAFVVMQFSSHEFASLSWGHAGKVEGTSDAVARFHAIIERSVIWYGAIALLLMALILPAGLYFFASQEVSAAHVSWRLPWTVLVLAAAVYVPVIPVLAAIEGSGEVAQVNRLRLIQGVGANLLTWAVIAGGGGLFAAPMVFLANAFFGYGWVARNYPALFVDVRSHWRNKTRTSFAWMTEVWPMQWRIAVSWVSGYFIFQLFTPILFYYHGPAQAGKMGMSLVIANMINNFAQVWLQANTPVLAQAVARKDWRGLDAMFGRIFLQSTAVSWVASLLALAGIWLFSSYTLGQRFLSLTDMAYLLAAFALTHMIGALAHYLRVHKQEPFMMLSVVGAILVASTMWYFGKHYGSTGIVISLFLINLVYGLPSALWLWLRLRKMWHQPAAQAGN